jgi:hypothetical protein
MKKFGLGIMTPVIPDELQSTQKEIEDIIWDPVRGMIRITYGITQ